MSASLREALYIIPCSNILASLRNCARDDMCERRAGGIRAPLGYAAGAEAAVASIGFV